MPKKERVLTDQQRAFLAALAGPAKGNMREAMTIAGYSENTMPSDVYSRLRDEIVEIAENFIAANSMKAANSMVEVLDNPTRVGTLNIISAAKELLDRAGVSKKGDGDKSASIKADTIFILPQKDGMVNIGIEKPVDKDEE